jgi:5-methylcytosine-specific restriction protein B
MPDAVSELAEYIQQGLRATGDSARPRLKCLFTPDGPYLDRGDTGDSIFRDAYGLANDDGTPWAGLVHPSSLRTGVYGGASLVWFPTDDGSLLTLIVGTGGIAPDDGLLTSPGHRRRVAALRRYLTQNGIAAWSKPDPALLDLPVPNSIVHTEPFAPFHKAFERYGRWMYCIARVPDDAEKARLAVQAFLSLYGTARGWQPRRAWQDQVAAFESDFRTSLFSSVTAANVARLLKRRRFVILQGPPGTGKTRLAEEVKRDHFGGSGMTVQFHPAVTYEDFVVGLSPDPSAGSLRFDVRRGWLTQAVAEAHGGQFLLVIDEVNRADLGKVLGEAIYLFEAGDVGGDRPRQVELPHAIDGHRTLAIPDGLYVLGTMNTADRSIASLDLAIRRRFAFVPIWPDRAVVEANCPQDGVAIFDRLTDVFVDHAPLDALDLLPGHAYFLAKNNEDEMRERFRYELLPLIDEYLREGYLGPATTELYAVRDQIEDLATRG